MTLIQRSCIVTTVITTLSAAGCLYLYVRSFKVVVPPIEEFRNNSEPLLICAKVSPEAVRSGLEWNFNITPSLSGTGHRIRICAAEGWLRIASEHMGVSYGLSNAYDLGVIRYQSYTDQGSEWLDASGQYSAYLTSTIALSCSMKFIMALLISATCLATILMYRVARRAPGLCTGCSYDLRGCTGDMCPECGVIKARYSN